jgi:hypothetical protein
MKKPPKKAPKKSPGDDGHFHSKGETPTHTLLPEFSRKLLFRLAAQFSKKFL